MKKIIAILCMCAGIGMTMNAAQSLGANGSTLLGPRVCLMQEYQWNEGASTTVTESDPLYCGGWTSTVVAGEGNTVIVEGGFTPYRLNQPMTVDMAAGRVTLEVNEEEPFATVTTTETTVNAGVTTQVDSTKSYYLVNEAWFVDGADLADVMGEILADGSIHIADGFAYFVEITITTTITYQNGTSTTYTDKTDAMSPIYRDTWLLVANGKHEFVSVEDGTTNTVDVNIRQDGETVWVTNLYGFGAPEVHMELSEGGTMSFPSQMLRDIPASVSPNGSGMWVNMGGNTGTVTAEAITWGQTTPTDNVQTWSGWTNNRLYFTDGNHFVVPGTEVGMRGDVNKDGAVTIADVTALINGLLTGPDVETDHFSPSNADCNQSGGVTIADVTVLINYLLSGSW